MRSELVCLREVSVDYKVRSLMCASDDVSINEDEDHDGKRDGHAEGDGYTECREVSLARRRVGGRMAVFGPICDDFARCSAIMRMPMQLRDVGRGRWFRG
jgi:hypothetical protein